MTKLMQLHTSM